MSEMATHFVTLDQVNEEGDKADISNSGSLNQLTSRLKECMSKNKKSSLSANSQRSQVTNATSAMVSAQATYLQMPQRKQSSKKHLSKVTVSNDKLSASSSKNLFS